MMMKEQIRIDEENKLLEEKGARYIEYITRNTHLLPHKTPRMPSDAERTVYEEVVFKLFDKREDKEELTELAIKTQFDMEDVVCLYPKGEELLVVSFSVVSRDFIESLKGKVGMGPARCAIIEFTKRNFLDTVIFVDCEHYEYFDQYIEDSAVSEFLHTFYDLFQTTFDNYINLDNDD